MRVGVAGLGKMGSALAKRLLEQGHEVTGWNRSPGREEALAIVGGAVAPSLAASSDIVCTLLSDDLAAAAVYGERRAHRA